MVTLILLLLLSFSSAQANTETKITEKISSNLYFTKFHRTSNKIAEISFLIDGNGKSKEISIVKNGVNDNVINQCMLAIHKSEPLPLVQERILFKCQNQEAIMAKDQKKFYRKYMNSVQKKIKANWHPTESGTSNRAVAKFKVTPKGEVQDIKMIVSSGNSDHDLLAKRAIETSSPFGEIPLKYFEKNEEFVDIEFTFDYNLITKKQSNNLDKANLGLNILNVLNHL
jgi:hypothetical protein